MKKSRSSCWGRFPSAAKFGADGLFPKVFKVRPRLTVLKLTSLWVSRAERSGRPTLDLTIVCGCGGGGVPLARV